MPGSTAARVVASCSFCPRPNTHMGTLVAGHGVDICDECVDLCSGVIAGTASGAPLSAPWEHDVALEHILWSLPRVRPAAAQVETICASGC